MSAFTSMGFGSTPSSSVFEWIGMVTYSCTGRSMLQKRIFFFFNEGIFLVVNSVHSRAFDSWPISINIVLLYKICLYSSHGKA